MPRSSASMSDYDGSYEFNIEAYLCKTYPNITKPARRAICDWVRSNIDEDAITEMIDQIVLEYALEQMGWTPPEDNDTE